MGGCVQGEFPEGGRKICAGGSGSVLSIALESREVGVCLFRDWYSTYETN